MLKLIRSSKAEADLIDIWLYIAEDQPVNADRFLDKLNKTAMTIAENPGLGVDRPEISDGIKSFPVDRYILYYRVKATELEIVRVLSSARDIHQLSW
jgi:toxin ParE1/3/4|tara:strand:- start:7844 stop:8134 length:291 start_codon:yes stop_codon:yes gene_type:complete